MDTTSNQNILGTCSLKYLLFSFKKIIYYLIILKKN